jgi:hypothetical protein
MFRTEMLHVQRWYRSTNNLAGLNLMKVPVNTRERFGLTDFWASLYNNVNILLPATDLTESTTSYIYQYVR